MATTEFETRIMELERDLSQRLTRLEQQVARLAQQMDNQGVPAETAWWKKIVGAFENDPEFDEAMRLGREYRESLRPPDEPVAEETA